MFGAQTLTHSGGISHPSIPDAYRTEACDCPQQPCRTTEHPSQRWRDAARKGTIACLPAGPASHISAAADRRWRLDPARPLDPTGGDQDRLRPDRARPGAVPSVALFRGAAQQLLVGRVAPGRYPAASGRFAGLAGRAAKITARVCWRMTRAYIRMF